MSEYQRLHISIQINIGNKKLLSVGELIVPSQYEKNMFIALLVVFAVTGSVIGIFVNRHQTIAHGLLGVAMMCLLVNRNFLDTRGTIEKLLLQPSRMKILFSVCTFSMLVYLSVMAIFKMLVSFLH
jgi:hypothetical protein